MSIKFKITRDGISDHFKKVNNVRKEVGGKVPKKAIQRIVTLVHRLVKINIKQDNLINTRNYSRSVNSRVIKKSKDSFLGVVGNSANYAQAIEDGTKPHEIRVKNAKVLAFPIARKSFFAGGIGGFFVLGQTPGGKTKIAERYIMLGKKVKHPGTKAYHVYQRALLSSTDQQISIIREEALNTARSAASK